MGNQKQLKNESKGSDGTVKICINVDEEVRNKYKARVALRGKSMQDDLEEYVKKTIKG
jgi:redox-regulated HSP33 family molecular chaperone